MRNLVPLDLHVPQASYSLLADTVTSSCSVYCVTAPRNLLVVLMHTAVTYTDYVLSNTTTKAHSKRDKTKKRSGGYDRSWWWSVYERLAAVMVVGAVFQFIRRLIVLVIGIVRLSYRKASITYNV